jgi:uncharacterized repeat protein (TIGR02543 family)
LKARGKTNSDKLIELIRRTKVAKKFMWYFLGALLATILALTALLLFYFIEQNNSKHLTLTFETNGGTKINMVRFDRGDVLSEPEYPTKSGYGFGGWYDSNIFIKSIEWEIPFESSITVYVKWVNINLYNDVENIRIPSIIEKDTLNLNFPVKGSNGSIFTYTISDESIISRKGIINHPNGDDDVTITLLLQASLKGENLFKYFHPLVKKTTAYSSFNTITKIYSSLFYDAPSKEVDIYYPRDGITSQLDIPFIDLKDYIDMMGDLINFNDFNFAPDYSNQIYTITYKYNVSIFLKFDVRLNTITLSSQQFYIYFIKNANWDNNEYITARTTVTDGESITYPLSKYHLSLVYNANTPIDNSKFLVPMSLANMFLSSYGDYKIYVTDHGIYSTYLRLLDDEYAMLLDTTTKKENFNELEMLDSYNFFAFCLEYFWGGFSGSEYTTGYDVFFAFKQYDCMKTNVRDFEVGLQALIRYYLDEIESNMDRLGLNNNYVGHHSTHLDDLQQGTNRQKHQIIYNNLKEQIKLNGWTDGSEEDVITLPDYRNLSNNSGIITISDFGIGFRFEDAVVQVKNALDSLKANNNNLTNVVLDLSLNVSTNYYSMIDILGFITNEEIVINRFSSANGALRTTTYTKTANLSKRINSYDLNWYILVSDYTANAASVLAQICKQNGWAKVIGQNSFPSASSTFKEVLNNGFTFSLKDTYSYGYIDEQGKFIAFPEFVIPDIVLDSSVFYNDYEFGQFFGSI